MAIITYFLLVSVIDIKYRIISNLLTLGFMSVCLVTVLFDMNAEIWDQILKSLFYVLIIMIPGYKKGFLGGADVKLFLGLALIFSPDEVLFLLIASFTLFCVYWMLFYRKTREAPFVPAIFLALTIQYLTI